MSERHRLAYECIAESIGTFLIVFFGTGAVAVAVLTGALPGLFQVAIVWGLGIALAIYCTGGISGAHLNPAVTLACAMWRGFSWKRVVPYWAAQLAGAIAASAVLIWLMGGLVQKFEAAKGILRGGQGSELSAMVMGEYFPSPAIAGVGAAAAFDVSLVQAMSAEAGGTLILVFVIFSLTEERNRSKPHPTMVALMIGLTVTALICVLAPLTQAGFNPARDLGPRLVAWLKGWGDVAIPGPRGGWWSVYVLSPLVGGVVGGGLQRLLQRGWDAAGGR